VCWCTSEACKYKNAIIVAATMASDNCNIGCKSIPQILHLNIKIFSGAFACKFYEQMVAFIQNRSLELY